AVDAQLIRIDAVVLGVMPNEADGAMHVLEDLGDGELRLAAVHDGEDRVAALQELIDKADVDHFVSREPTAADDKDQAEAVLVFLRLEDIHRQRRAVFAAVDDVFLAGEVGTVAGEHHAVRQQQDHAEQSFHRKSSEVGETLSPGHYPPATANRKMLRISHVSLRIAE